MSSLKYIQTPASIIVLAPTGAVALPLSDARFAATKELIDSDNLTEETFLSVVAAEIHTLKQNIEKHQLELNTKGLNRATADSINNIIESDVELARWLIKQNLITRYAAAIGKMLAITSIYPHSDQYVVPAKLDVKDLRTSDYTIADNALGHRIKFSDTPNVPNTAEPSGVCIPLVSLLEGHDEIYLDAEGFTTDQHLSLDDFDKNPLDYDKHQAITAWRTLVNENVIDTHTVKTHTISYDVDKFTMDGETYSYTELFTHNIFETDQQTYRLFDQDSHLWEELDGEPRAIHSSLLQVVAEGQTLSMEPSDISHQLIGEHRKDLVREILALEQSVHTRLDVFNILSLGMALLDKARRHHKVSNQWLAQSIPIIKDIYDKADSALPCFIVMLDDYSAYHMLRRWVSGSETSESIVSFLQNRRSSIERIVKDHLFYAPSIDKQYRFHIKSIKEAFYQIGVIDHHNRTSQQNQQPTVEEFKQWIETSAGIAWRQRYTQSEVFIKKALEALENTTMARAIEKSVKPQRENITYCLEFFDTAEKLQNAGKILKNCIGNYVSDLEKCKLVIFGIYDNTNHLFGAVQIDMTNGSIHQIHGRRNSDLGADIKTSIERQLMPFFTTKEK